MLEPIPTVRLWFVLVTPPVVIDSKTSALYAGLTASDFSDGAAVLGIADRLRHGLPPDQQVPNAFARQLMSFSAVRYAYDRLTQAGSRVVSISGAGPTVYAVTDTWPQAAQIVSRLPQDVGEIRVACAIHASDDQRTARLALALRGVSPE
jgi:4-diphosphocytidyl-2C-methyl-D-erythritol kinase